ncbi:MAG: DUF1553 domain-containing protein [Planctomycetes bacterium]|nr:DUF1553 domain-containing protein [Planctomycetota bacterium]
MPPRPRRRVSAVAVGLFAAGLAAQARPLPPLSDAAFAARREHWAWSPLAVVEPPGPATTHPVDAFVDARLAAAGLRRSPSATPSTLLRRLWFDVVGLPPPPEAVVRFTSDPSDAAYERELDALLASPQFGERWARHWLDLVRYAETLGHEYDFPVPNAWRYRDYVIRALNHDVPYDQFVREHIAGDLLPTPRRGADGDDESVQATAAWWFVEQTHSPVDAKKHEADRIDNQIDVLGKALLGLTIACARCHDHKFDAIRADDYYALYGFVRSSRYVQAPLQAVDPAGDGYRAALAAQRAVATAWLAAAPAAEWAPLRDDPAALAPASGVGPLRAEDELIASADGDRADWILTNDGFGDSPWHAPFCPDPEALAPRLLSLPGPFWLSAAAGSGRDGVLQTRTFPLTQRYLHVRVAGEHARVNVVVDGLHLVRDPIYGPLHAKVHCAEAHWLTFDCAPWRDRPAFLQCLDQRAQDLADADQATRPYPDAAWLAVQLVVLSAAAEPPPTTANAPLPAPGWSEPPPDVRTALTALAKATAALPVSPTIPSLGDGTGVDEHVFVRGDHRRPAAPAPRRFLRALDGDAPLPVMAGSGRLQLADRLLRPDNPLPPRVLVNRLWHHLFGRGLVRTVDNLGALGEPPSHPELLDWLAHDCVAHGWSIKHTLRLLLTSATYRQQSRRGDAGEVADADNVLLHRQNVRRLEAEAVRDALLAASGRLDATCFGPSIELPHSDQIEARGRPRASGPPDGDGRRSIYLAMRRNFMPPMLQAFDLPTPFATVGARSVSNVPAQALTLANDTFVHTMCERLGQRVLDEAGTADDRLTRCYLLLLGRPPDATERRLALAFVGDVAVATTDLGAGFADPRSWAALAHALVNSTEFSYRR